MNPICVICKIDLEEQDINVFQCPKCQREYIGEYEIMNFGDEVGTAFDDEAATIELEGIAGASKPIIESHKDLSPTDDNNSSSVLEQEKSTKSDIKIPKYLKDSETNKVIEYEEQ
jgi:hypothetical protein